ncbi:N-acetyltransferase [Fodinibacter luteus]|uniref:N-acetyltransferase n=1 Tax=Fodinibacter luteus TaxID=552064 RepID=A0ABP8KI88_9MICO
MNPDLVIRRELPGDEEPTRALHDAAFGVPDGAAHSVETRILDRLRAAGDVLDSLTLVADLHGEVVGHVVCSRATMGEGPSVGLGPIAVAPEHQGEGIGSALVAAVLVTADQRREPSVVLLGDPGWYAHFGFETAAAHGIGSPGPWEDRFFLVRRLQAWRPELAGPFAYAPAFDVTAG